MIGNIGPVQLLIILLIVLLIFGTKRIRSLGSDLGGAIKEFRKGMGDDASSQEAPGDQASSEKAEADQPTDDSGNSSDGSSGTKH